MVQPGHTEGQRREPIGARALPRCGVLVPLQ